MPWTNITNAQLAVGSPIRSIDLLALRDNITAQANGDAGAPQQQTAGIADNAVTAAKVNKGNGIGSSGTQLAVACPAANTVGSYAFGGQQSYNNHTFNYGSNYAAGTGVGQISTGAVFNDGNSTNLDYNNSFSGTWKWLGRSFTTAKQSCAVVCRVS